jgi:hypothetical protein
MFEWCEYGAAGDKKPMVVLTLSVPLLIQLLLLLLLLMVLLLMVLVLVLAAIEGGGQRNRW